MYVCMYIYIYVIYDVYDVYDATNHEQTYLICKHVRHACVCPWCPTYIGIGVYIYMHFKCVYIYIYYTYLVCTWYSKLLLASWNNQCAWARLGANDHGTTILRENGRDAGSLRRIQRSILDPKNHSNQGESWRFLGHVLWGYSWIFPYLALVCPCIWYLQLKKKVPETAIDL